MTFKKCIFRELAVYIMLCIEHKDPVHFLQVMLNKEEEEIS